MVVAVAWRARYAAGGGWWVAATIGTFIGVIVLHTAWDTFAATLTTHLVIALISPTGLLLATRVHPPVSSLRILVPQIVCERQVISYSVPSGQWFLSPAIEIR